SVECEGKLVGFLSAFDCGEELEVHYVGLDYDCNRELGLYQRMLVEFLRRAIEGGHQRINYGRTAEQAKSSLGAEPVEMRLYTKHRNMIANRLITPLMASVAPNSFELRSPFKQVKVS
ncbi:MAG: GNAT family N-acetyltransferase, partial [Flavobacteriales bacterium]|nr:GNAT family N-acetyltransferase [Flavobacteriales bacterium]